MTRSWPSWHTCQVCGKRSYASRAAARLAGPHRSPGQADGCLPVPRVLASHLCGIPEEKGRLMRILLPSGIAGVFLGWLVTTGWFQHAALVLRAVIVLTVVAAALAVMFAATAGDDEEEGEDGF